MQRVLEQGTTAGLVLLGVLVFSVLLSPRAPPESDIAGTAAKAARASAPSPSPASLAVASGAAPLRRTSYLSAGARLARLEGGALQFFHSDHLGTAAARTDGAGAQVDASRQLPFGGQLGPVSRETEFTGKKLDAGSDLYYFGGRHYQADTGRFVAADPVMRAATGNYLYADNRPLGMVDATGAEPVPIEQEPVATVPEKPINLEPVRPPVRLDAAAGLGTTTEAFSPLLTVELGGEFGSKDNAAVFGLGGIGPQRFIGAGARGQLQREKARWQGEAATAFWPSRSTTLFDEENEGSFPTKNRFSLWYVRAGREDTKSGTGVEATLFGGLHGTDPVFRPLGQGALGGKRSFRGIEFSARTRLYDKGPLRVTGGIGSVTLSQDVVEGQTPGSAGTAAFRALSVRPVAGPYLGLDARYRLGGVGTLSMGLQLGLPDLNDGFVGVHFNR